MCARLIALQRSKQAVIFYTRKFFPRYYRVIGVFMREILKRSQTVINWGKRQIPSRPWREKPEPGG